MARGEFPRSWVVRCVPLPRGSCLQTAVRLRGALLSARSLLPTFNVRVFRERKRKKASEAKIPPLIGDVSPRVDPRAAMSISHAHACDYTRLRNRVSRRKRNLSLSSRIFFDEIKAEQKNSLWNIKCEKMIVKISYKINVNINTKIIIGINIE